jgi:hypothetical protein
LPDANLLIFASSELGGKQTLSGDLPPQIKQDNDKEAKLSTAHAGTPARR